MQDQRMRTPDELLHLGWSRCIDRHFLANIARSTREGTRVPYSLTFESLPDSSQSNDGLEIRDML